MTCHETQFHDIAIVIGLKIIDLHIKSNDCINRFSAAVLQNI